MAHYSIAEAEEQLDELIDRALAGEIVVITRDGVPVVEVQPIHQTGQPITAADLAWMAVQRSDGQTTEDTGMLISRMRDEV